MAAQAKQLAQAHLSEEALESYAFGRLPLSELPRFEEHLFQCEHCQQLLDCEDEFADAVRARRKMEDSTVSPASSPARGVWDWTAVARSRLLGKRLSLRQWSSPEWGPALMLTIGIAIGIAVWNMPFRTRALEADEVTLTTLRGGGDGGMAQARPDRPLELSMQAPAQAPGEAPGEAPGKAPGGEAPGEVSGPGSSLPGTGTYRLEVVDALGSLAWTGPAQAISGRIAAHVDKRLSAGVYWVRLYAPSNKLLREFGLRVK